MANPFNRPKRAHAHRRRRRRPYHRARQVWDDRMGLAIGHARNWRLMAFANLGVAVVPRPRLVGAGCPRHGQALRGGGRELGPDPEDHRARRGVPSQAMPRSLMRSRAGSPTLRSKSVDPVVVKSDWLAAYDLTTPKSAAFLNGLGRRPTTRSRTSARSAVSVEVQDVVRRSDDTYDVQWRETRFLDGQKASPKSAGAP